MIFWAVVALAVASDVVDLSASTFDAKVKDKDVFIKFYAPWCGHCKALAPTWEKAATELKNKALFAKVDCTQNEALCAEFEVQGYPTLIFQTKDGKLSEYNGGRSVAEFEKFAANPTSGGPAKRTKAAAPPPADDDAAADEARETAVVALSGQAAFEAAVKGKQAIVEFYAPWCGFCKKLAPTWDDLSIELQGDNILTAKVDCTDAANYLLCKEFGVRGYPTLVFIDRDGAAFAPEEVERELAPLAAFARSGARTGKPIVKPFMLRTGIAFLDSNWPLFRDDMLALYNFKKAALAITFGAGLLIGALLVVLFGPKPRAAAAAAASTKKTN